MKSFQIVAVALTAAATSFSFAQQENSGTKLRAYVQMDQGKVAMLEILNSSGSNFQFMNELEQMMQLDANKLKLFYINTPDDLAAAMKTASSRDYAAARKQLAACKAKYMGFSGLPGNPSLQAALLELNCAVKQLDWAGVKGITDSFPAKSLDNKVDIGTILRVRAGKVLGNVSDDAGGAEAQIKAAEELLNNKGAMKQCDTTTYGWLKYAVGRAQAALVPADQVAAGNISEENAPKAHAAIDTLCEAAMSSHSTDRELALDAMLRAQALLWAMPGVQDYANRGANMDAARWSAAPDNFKDAVALANLIRKVYGYEGKDAKLDRAASLWFNTLQGKAK